MPPEPQAPKPPPPPPPPPEQAEAGPVYKLPDWLPLPKSPQQSPSGQQQVPGTQFEGQDTVPGRNGGAGRNAQSQSQRTGSAGSPTGAPVPGSSGQRGGTQGRQTPAQSGQLSAAQAAGSASKTGAQGSSSAPRQSSPASTGSASRTATSAGRGAQQGTTPGGNGKPRLPDVFDVTKVNPPQPRPPLPTGQGKDPDGFGFGGNVRVSSPRGNVPGQSAGAAGNRASSATGRSNPSGGSSSGTGTGGAGNAISNAANAALGAQRAVVDPEILRKLGRIGKAGVGETGGASDGESGSGGPVPSGVGARAASRVAGIASRSTGLTISSLDVSPLEWKAPEFKAPEWKPPEFRAPNASEIPWTSFGTNPQYPGGANNLAYTYGQMSGRVATDLGPWREWLATQNIAYLEQLARAGGYPNLAAALTDSRNLLRQARDTGFRQWAWGPSVSSGAIGIWASEAQHNLGRAQVLLGDLLQQSRAFESTGGLTDVGISGLDLAYILRDFGLEDGDIVDVRIEQFGRTIFSTRLSLLNAGTAFQQTLRPGLARLVITAVNEGFASPNTAEVRLNNVTSGNATQSYSLRTGETATLRIETNRRGGQ